MSELQIDWTRCDGHGLCAALLPQKITLDDWGFPVIDPTRPVRDRELRRAVAVCPALALRLETADPRERERTPH